MNISDAAQEMSILNIPSNAFSIGDPSQDESFCIRERNGDWEVFYYERGVKTGLRIFREKHEACENFLSRIKSWHALFAIIFFILEPTSIKSIKFRKDI
ncbi:hypothetical protein [Janthinobacterium sp. 13]|uniref:hypothetical protein n=1 Tax=Janthinobacterium sp. 13 TaxID=2035211 RepID=UPI000C43DEB3|nr:hypothetical protein [Janthinobacterium sp. 13]PIF09603.1 hypothetical protein CLU94_1603 [Janthinobacterium sp. 13]